MIKKKLSKKLWYGSEVDSAGNVVLPPLAESADDLNGLHYGELYLHIMDDKLSLWTRTATDKIKQVGSGGSGSGSIWEVRATESGQQYVYSRFPVVTQQGVTMYAAGEELNIPSIAQSLPFDGKTIRYNKDTNQIEVIGGTGGGGGGGGEGGGVSYFWDLDGIPDWITNSKPKYSYTEIEGTPDLAKYALKTDIPSLSGYATESWVKQQGYLTSHQSIYTLTFQSGTFSAGSFTANSAAKTINIPTTTSHISEGTNLYFTNARAVSALSETLKAYVTLAGSQTITGEKNFTGGLKVNGSPIYYDSSKKYWKLEGDLLVTGGVTMFGNEGTYTPSTIMDAINVDGTTISKEGGVLRVIGGTGGGVADSVAWANITGKPTFASVATSGKYSDLSGTPTSLKNPTSLTFGSKTYDGSAAMTITASDLGALTSHQDISHLLSKTDASNTYQTKITSSSKLAYSLISGTPSLASVATSGKYDDLIGKPTLLSSFTDDVVSGKYLPLSGGTLTNSLVVSSGTISSTRTETRRGVFYKNASASIDNGTYIVDVSDSGDAALKLTYDNLTWKSQKIWHQGNDGSGSGLDADLLDGKHLSDILASNVASATKLQTARTIWGQSFDGTGNVSGVLTMPINNQLQWGDSSTMIYGAEGKKIVIYTNYVGIGTTGPQYKLDVNGTSRITSNNDTGIALELESSSTYCGIGIKQKNGYRWFIGSENTKELYFNYEGNNLFKFSSNGGITGANFIMSNVTDGYFVGNRKDGAGTTDGGLMLYTYGKTPISIWAGGSERMYVASDGNVGIGTTSPSAKFHVAGDAITNSITANGGISSYRLELWATTPYIDFHFGSSSAYYTTRIVEYSLGELTLEASTVKASNNLLAGGGITMYSDQRKKTILNNVELSLKQIANAPLIEHYYNSDEKKTTHVGSIAQYWYGMNDWFCKEDTEGYLTMEIQNAALASAISVARELDRYETKTDKTIKQLRKRICQLEEELERLKSA